MGAVPPQCWKCGGALEPDGQFCPFCGAPKAPSPPVAAPPPSPKIASFVCPACRALLEAGARFCNSCGRVLSPQPAPAPVTSQRPPLPVFLIGGAAAAVVLVVAVVLLLARGGGDQPGPSSVPTSGAVTSIASETGASRSGARKEQTPVSIRGKAPTVSTASLKSGKGVGWIPFQVAPGEVLAEGDVGPAGGRLDVPGHVSIEFPAGSIEAQRKVVVHATKAPVADGCFFFIDVEGRSGPLAKPARVSFDIPDGVDTKGLLALHQVHPTCWISVPGTYDAANRKLTAEFSHFSAGGWFNATNMIRLVGGAAASVGAGVTFIFFTGITGGAPLAVVLAAGFFTGAEAAGPASDAYKKRGLRGHLSVLGFDIHYKPETIAPGPRRIIRVDEKFKITCIAIDGRKDAQGKPLPAEVIAGDLKAPFLHSVEYPEVICDLARQLQAVKHWYRYAGYEMQDRLTVHLRDDLGSTKSAGKEKNAGEWDGRILNLNVGLMANVEGAQGVDLRTTLAHEVWHTVFTHNGFSEGVFGLDDMMATTFESAVWPDSTSFSANYGWGSAAPVLANGLLRTVRGEDFTNPGDRGYALWSFGKFLLHTQGHDVIRSLSGGKMGNAELDALFVNFTRAVLTTDQGLDDPMPLESPTGTVNCPTGWSSRSLDSLMNGVGGVKPIEFGRYEDAPGRRPLSLLLQRFRVPPTPVPSCPVVVRQMRPDPILEIAGLPPHPQRIILTPPARFDELTITRSSQVFAGLLASNMEDFILPLAIIVRTSASAELDSMTPNALYAYRLAPPRAPRLMSDPGSTPNDARSTLSWTEPELGGGLSSADVLAGYRLFGRKEDGRIIAILDLLFETTEMPENIAKHWYKSDLRRGELLRNDTDFLIDDKELADCVEIGMASIDGIARVDGTPAFSPVTWFRRSLPPLNIPLAHQVEAVLGPEAWAGARNRVSVALNGSLQVPQGTINFNRPLREHGSNVLDVYASSGWVFPITVSLSVEPNLGSGKEWTSEVSLGTGKDAKPGQVQITLSSPTCVLVVQNPPGTPESDLGGSISINVPSGDDLSRAKPAGKTPGNQPAWKTDQQYNVRVALTYDYKAKFFRHTKDGPAFVKDETGKVRAYILHLQVDRKP